MEKVKKEKKKVNKKMVLIILGIIVGVIALLTIVNIIANKAAVNKAKGIATSYEKVEIENQLVPEKDTNGYWTFTTDRELKILQFTDVHIAGGWASAKTDKMALQAVATMIIAEKPDLVVVTGDLVYPTPLSLTINNKAPAEIFASLMETLGVYWVPVFGNHDSEVYNLYTREKIAEYYGSSDLKYCLFQSGDENIYGYGNSVINVRNTDGVITQSLYLIDSNAYPENSFFGLTGGYDNVHEDQIEWYKNTYEKLNAQNKAYIEKIYADDEDKKNEALEQFGLIKSLMFMHIPPVEYSYAWDEYQKGGDAKYFYGAQGEDVCHPKEDDMLFETMVEIGGTKGVFCGHDHINTYSIEYKGIRLTYGMSIDYLAYSNIDTLGSQRGCTIITVKPDGSFDCTPSSYYQDKYVNPEKEEVTMQELVNNK